MSGMEYDTSSPFPPTAEQLRFTGKILGNSVAALFAQQSPSPEMSYAAVVAEQLWSYTKPIIDYTLNQFKQECCDRLFGDFKFAKAAANKALDNLEKILLLNNHYQLMLDFSVWDIYNPPSLLELKLLSKRHPYQPISELLRVEVDSLKKIIHSQIESIVQYRQIKSEGKEDCPHEGSSRRYYYPPSENYFRLENNIGFNVVGGKQCQYSIARDFQISINELIALEINSEAKFTKVFREGINKCFLMPAEFKDDTMRTFFRCKFEEFINDSVNSHIKHGNRISNFMSTRSSDAFENADFEDEHEERCKIEQEYAKCIGTSFIDAEKADFSMQSSTENHDKLIDDDSPLISGDVGTLKEDGRGINRSLFKREVKRARKHFIDNREVCLLDWKVRDDARELLEKLCLAITEIINGNHDQSPSKEEEAQNSRTLLENADQYFELIRKTNVELENNKFISQILDSTLIQ